MKDDQRVSKTVLQWISIAVGGCLLGGFLVALLFGLFGLAGTLAICLLAFIAGFILGYDT